MGKSNVQFCADAGGKYCPCHLAYSGDCIKCSLIKGEKVCDCKWQGVCVYNEMQHNLLSPVEERDEFLAKVIERKEIDDNVYYIKIKIPRTIIRNLCEPGAYVFLKDRNKIDSIYNAPISVMDVDEENSILEVIVVPRGIKTKPLVHSDEVIVKAPYFNGIFGIREIKSCSFENCVLILDGMSQVNSINVIRRLLRNNNNVEVFINENEKKLEVVEEKLENMGVCINYFNMTSKKKLLIDYIIKNNVTFVYSCGLIPFNKTILNMIHNIDEKIKFAIPNNNLICCGEGICGACTIRLNGCRVKTCKSQMNGRDFLRGL